MVYCFIVGVNYWEFDSICFIQVFLIDFIDLYELVYGFMDFSIKVCDCGFIQIDCIFVGFVQDCIIIVEKWILFVGLCYIDVE